ncbi:carboxypeptidase-like regulatory domain-containing protein [Dyadobacter sp. 676]|uniref:Carboxypeptidase-like regulatory domain-containing protein n=1 Tax=Dyadobacter sp. 676 TaxID=3088362 RepID=A0AAU8FJ96_9BACT
MQIRKILHTGLLCALSFVALAQQDGVSLSGHVRSEDGEALPGASVSLKGTSHGTFTGADGKYTLEHVRPGNYRLLVSFMGYRTQARDITLKAGEHFRHNARLVPEARELESVSVIGRTETKEINRQAYNVTAIDARKLPELDARSFPCARPCLGRTCKGKRGRGVEYEFLTEWFHRPPGEVLPRWRADG